MAKQHLPRNPELYNGMPSLTNRRWGPDRSNTSARGHRGKGPAGYVRADTSIADEIVDRLTEDDTLDASQILLQIEEGVVTVTGNVPTRAMKHRAEDIAAEARGVRDVRNEIRVDDGSASGGPPGQAVRVGS